MLIAQISDPHVKAEGRLAYRVVDTATRLAACIDHLAALRPRPDVVVATGDLADLGRPEEYARLRAHLAVLPMPVFLVAGNHDERDALRAAFPDHGYLPRDGFLHYVVEDLPLRLVVLDTVVPGEGGGLMCADRLTRLDARLAAAPDRPTAIAMHHPPFATGIAHMDAIGLEGRDAFAGTLARHPQVVRILCGHLHRPIQALVGRVLASTAPSTAHQVALDLTPEGPSRFMLEPPGYQLHLWRPGIGMISHTAVIGAFDGPYPFFQEGRLID